MSTGDDLAQARRFSNLCQETMSSLMKSTHALPDNTIPMLETIQTQAREMQARAISRTARLAIDDLTASKPHSKGAGSLLALNKLICQYTDGLDELAPEDILPYADPAELEEKLRALLVLQEAEMNAAQDTAQSLLFLARQGQERESLRALTRLSHFGNDEGHVRKLDPFDVLMPAVTNESLRRARLAKKSVSVSYAADDVLMDPAMTLPLQAAIITICEGLVDRCIEAPLRRKNKGLSGAAHIAITARRRASSFDVLITCEGPAPGKALLAEKPIIAIMKQGAEVNVSDRKGLTRIEMSNLPTADRQSGPERSTMLPRKEMSA